MKIKNTYPPNIEEIKKVLSPPENAVFTYGDTMYNPKKLDIPEDLFVHERVHIRQQTDPIKWWNRYLKDPTFRLEQEVEAYGKQYKYIKETCNNKEAKFYLYQMSSHLASEMYGNIISFQKAESKIRNIIKTWKGKE